MVSVGFIPHSLEWDDDTPVPKDNELLEISVVCIGANPSALALAYKDGSMSTSDARWLAKSMKEQAEAIEKQVTTSTKRDGPGFG